jgi:hypothetical protein
MVKKIIQLTHHDNKFMKLLQYIINYKEDNMESSLNNQGNKNDIHQ